MTSWRFLKTRVVSFWRLWKAFFLWSCFAALVLRFAAELGWSLVLLFVFGLFVARELAYDLIRSSVVPAAHPRIWTFKLDMAKSFLEKMSVQLSEENRGGLLALALAKFGSSDEWLDKLVIEEYRMRPARVRAHLWLVPTSSKADSQGARYDLVDLDFGEAQRFEGTGGWPLWAYSTDEMPGELVLSGSWEWDATKKRDFFQLTLWVDRGGKRREIPPSDIIFKIPLEPGRLCDEQGETVSVQGEGGVEFKASDVEPFPYTAHRWAYESGKGSDSQWSWNLYMKTT